MSQTPRVFFNASVILAGLHSPTGGSAKLLDWVQKKHIKGVISELILDEVIRRSSKIGLSQQTVKNHTQIIFPLILPAPQPLYIARYQKVVSDRDDAHVLASCQEINGDFLASLDQKHILSLKHRQLPFQIVSPGELIRLLSSN